LQGTNDSGRLAGRVALITGAARGQGRAATLRFASEGAQVFITDLNAEGLEETLQIALEAGGDVRARAADITDRGEREQLIAEVKEEFGALHCLYANHGLVSGLPVPENTEEEWDAVYSVNAKSVYFLVQVALPLLRESKSAAIITVASMAGAVGIPNGTVYGSAKAALTGMTVNLAYELADDDIRVYCLLPGCVDTPMPRQYLESFPTEEREAAEANMVQRQLFKRLAEPEEIVGVAAFLASPDASFMTGSVLPVDGGWTAW
jgi:meso-butanediol dehydrogenase/(S,S)-butanediol dehydrogenase/diacetyl reductase